MTRAALVALALACAAKPAAALSCKEPHRVAVALPEAGATVPTNARPLLLLDSDVREPARPPVALVCATESGDRIPIDIDIRASGGRPSELLELVPRTLLPPGASCAVVGDEHERWHTWFRVGAHADRRAPAPGPIRPAQIARDEWGSGPRAVIPVSVAREDLESGLAAAIWLKPENDDIDYEQPPDTWAFVRRGKLVLTGGGGCDALGFHFPSLGEPALVVGIRLVDTAGNRSTPLAARVEPFPNAWQAAQIGKPATAAFVRPVRAAVPEDRTPTAPFVVVLAALAVAAWAVWTERDDRV
jgi:hypothetical protein